MLMMVFSSYDLGNLCLVALLALGLNLLLGGPKSLYQPLIALHPARWWHHFVQRAESKMNRSHREKKVRARRGLSFTLFSLLALVIAAAFLMALFMLPFGDYIELLALTLCLGARQGFDLTTQTLKLLKKAPQSVSAELLPAAITRRDQTEYDHATILRSMIENLALILQLQIIAPLFYYILFGWPLVLIAGGVAVMDRHLGSQNRKLSAFGGASRFIHGLLQWLPARITAILLCLAACFSTGAHPLKAWKIMLAQAGTTQSANSGWPLSAMAGALHITLGGPRSLQGAYINDAWIGQGSPKLKPSDLARGRWLFMVSNVLVILLLALGVILGE